MLKHREMLRIYYKGGEIVAVDGLLGPKEIN